MTDDMASGRDPKFEIEDDGPTLKPDLSDLFASRVAAPRPARAEEALFQEESGSTEPGTASGLIDIRSLASAYQAEKGLGEMDADEAPDLPKIPLAAPEPEPIFEGAPALVPNADRRDLKRTLLLFSGIALGAVAVTAIATALIVRATLGGQDAEQVASAGLTADVTAAPPASAGDIEAPAAAAVVPMTEADEPDDEPTDEATEVPDAIDATAPAAVPASPTAPANTASADRAQARADRRALARDQNDEDLIVLEPLAAPTTAPAPVAVAPEPAPAPASARKTEEYDVECLLEPNRPGCRADTAAAAAAPEVKLPEYLQRSDIEAGLAPFRGRLRTCAEQHETRGVVNLSVTVAADGKVSRVEVGDGEAAFKDCVARLLRQASFARTRSGHTFRYPLVLR